MYSPAVTEFYSTDHLIKLNNSLRYLQFVYEVFAVRRHLTTGLLQLTPFDLHSDDVFVDYDVDLQYTKTLRLDHDLYTTIYINCNYLKQQRSIILWISL